MKQTELMIGDWVLVPKLIDEVEDIKGHFQIRQLRDCDLDVFGFKELKYNEVKPIPITTEILERNGFKIILAEDINFYRAEYKDNDNRGIYYFESKLMAIGNYKTNNRAEIHCEYVHELQNALRLCGIKKEMEL